MESFHTRIRENIRRFFLFANYLLWLVLSPSKFKKVNNKEIKKVLIISFGAIGELLILTPLVVALKKDLDCEISFMISSENKNVFKHNPDISEVIVHQNNFKKDIQELKKRKFNLAMIVFPGSFKYSFMCLLAGIKYQIGWGNDFRRGPPLFFNKNMLQGKRKPIVEDNLDIIRLIGIDNENPKIKFYTSKKEEENVRKKLKKLKVKEYIIIHPGFGRMNDVKNPTRLWPIERYAKVIDYLSKKYPYDILIEGSKNEKEINEKVLKLTKEKNKIINVTGLFNLEELGYLISKSKLVICPNTSIVHFASVYETPLVELEGFGRKYQWVPLMKDKNYKILHHNEVCTGCNEMDCRKKNNECMKAITVEEVIKSINQILG